MDKDSPKVFGNEALARHILAGNYYECAWNLFRYGQFKGLDNEQAALRLAA